MDIKPVNDPVNPSHYNSHPSGIQAIEVTRHMNFNVGNAMKYLWRAGLKGSAVEDLKKAAWYISDEIGKLDPSAGKGVAGKVVGDLQNQLRAQKEISATRLKRIARLEAYLQKLSRLGNGESPGNSEGNLIAQIALKNE